MRKLLKKYVAVVDGWIEENNHKHMITALKEILKDDTCNEEYRRPSNPQQRIL